MASEALPAKYLSAGAEYLQALSALSLHPSFLGWGWETSAKQWVLVLVTSIVDAGGPLALNDLLFKAYNARATPKEISPFLVRVFSPEIVPDDLLLIGEKNLTVVAAKDKNTASKVLNISKAFLGIELEMTNSYQTLPQRKRKFLERRKEWDRFKASVERLAA